MLTRRVIDSPLGPLTIEAHEDSLSRVCFGAGSEIPGPSPVADAAESQLDAYFAGASDRFDLQLSPSGTDFQQAVWQELLAIPHGQTISYGELARRIGKPSAARAVGAANGANPIAIIIPCHRVIDAQGRPHGYAGGLERKQHLLELERARTAPGLFTLPA